MRDSTVSDDREHSRVGPSTPHGYGDDARSRFLRRRPPAAALSWVEDVLGGSITRIDACKGGSSSAIHALRVSCEDESQTVILRRYVIDELNAEEPDIAEREARVLQFLERCELTTPRLLAVDASGVTAGVPSVLMTRVPGRLDWTPTDIDRWLHDLASVLPALHATQVTASDRVQAFQPYAPPSWDPPPWLKQPALWDRAVEMFHQPPLDPDRVFIHRDYHPGNVLWRRGRVTGVVDWQAASVGPRSVDVFWCWSNLIGQFGLEVADRFVDIWERLSGDAYHRWAEVVMLVDVIGWTHERKEQEQRDLESALARSLAEFGR